MFRLDAVISQYELSIGVRSHTSEVRASFHCVFVLIPRTLWQFVWDHFFFLNISVADGINFRWANTDEQHRAGCMHNDHQSLPPDCGGRKKTTCTRRVNTETLTSLASETNYASYIKKTTNCEKYKIKKVAVLFYVATDLSVRWWSY